MSRDMLRLFSRKGQHLRDELLSSYLDGQVTPREQAQVEEHIASCQRCQEALAGLRHTVQLLHQVPEFPVPRAFVLSGVPQPLSRQAPMRVWALGAVASVTVALFVGIVSADLTGLLAPDIRSVAYLERAESVSAAPRDIVPEALQVEVVKEVEKEVVREIAVEVVREVAVEGQAVPVPPAVPVSEAVATTPVAEQPTAVPVEAPSPGETGDRPSDEVSKGLTPATWRIAETLLGIAALFLVGFTLWWIRRRHQQR